MALKFDENGLIPAIVQDFQTKQVLMLAYMNEESLAISLAERRTCFWSRSRQQLWRKGEESGNVQHIVSITADCDEDALLVQVCKEGPACHTGQESCFFQPLFVDEQVQSLGLAGLYQLLQGRQQQPQAGSYTSYLFEKGLDKILKKVGEECAETIIAAKNGDKAELVGEINDVFYHMMVMMEVCGVSLEDVTREMDVRAEKIGNLKQFHVSDHNT